MATDGAAGGEPPSAANGVGMLASTERLLADLIHAERLQQVEDGRRARGVSPPGTGRVRPGCGGWGGPTR